MEHPDHPARHVGLLGRRHGDRVVCGLHYVDRVDDQVRLPNHDCGVVQAPPWSLDLCNA